ncbi:hypothetical protein [Bdellovibrio sp. KM01]|uniref:hypothetical protein n=1 Tax=Bdellovibrio sp. KM01 TaxID=2748865 RepID=UPI0015EA370B|nr:hypothetical protein [Bdellovibrio sp. KM01]QLY24829.1 hypothetical protein HW988_15540 [Bdellovibrio sp. KM01]
MLLSKSFTADKRFAIPCGLIIAFVLSLGSIANAAESCTSIFSEGNAWPPANWKQHLQEVKVHAKSQPMGNVQRKYVETPADDPRLYYNKYGEHHVDSTKTNWEFSSFLEADIQAEVQSVSQKYQYVESHNSTGGPYLFKNTQSQREFIVYDIPRLSEFPSSKKYSAALEKYLGRIEKIVEEGIWNKDLDNFFHGTNPLQNGKMREKIAQGKTLKAARSTFLSAPTHVTAFPVELIPGTKMGRIAFREEWDQGDMVTTVIRTQIVGSTKATEALMLKGKEEQKKWVIDLISEIYPDYVDRRHWTESFIKADFNEVLETLNSTTYVMVRAKGASGKPGELLAALGINRAPYGKAQMRDPQSGRWMEFTGSFGSTVYDLNPTAQSTIPADMGLIREGKVPLLKMEAYLGEGFRMPRPSVIEAVKFDNNSPRFVNGEFVGKQPVYMSSGEIFEPVKFYLSRTNQMRGEALTSVFSHIADLLIQPDRDHRPAELGQAMYTFNPKTEGSRLYTKRGMNLMKEYGSAEKDGTEWHIFGSSIESYLNNFHHPDLTERENKEAAQSLYRLRRYFKVYTEENTITTMTEEQFQAWQKEQDE